MHIHQSTGAPLKTSFGKRPYLAKATVLRSFGESIFAHFGSYGLYCLDFEGNMKWKRDFGKMHSKHGHGEGSSPVLCGDSLVINWDHEEGSFVRQRAGLLPGCRCLRYRKRAVANGGDHETCGRISWMLCAAVLVCLRLTPFVAQGFAVQL